MNRKIKKILIANRSEIASRIQTTCKKLDIKTVAIYSHEDQFASFVHDSDEAYPLSKNGSRAYLEQNEIIQIAKKTNTDAIIPGYGFLSENSIFAQKIIDSGLIWIGPQPKIIELMGNKNIARKMMEEINIPIIPGFRLNYNETEEGKKLAKQIGYPVLLKDPLAGGGKAMRKVENEKEFYSAWERIKSESSKLTGSQEILLEKFIQKGRHIEIQICGDGKNFIHLFERECSIQRRHQKIIEQTPCNTIDQKILNKMLNAAIKIAKHVKYNNIGTIEFIVAQDQKFYFLEMNTRLQVEHSVTEFTTDIDLVEMQIQLAQNEKLPIRQKDISRKNYSIECRIYSEDPENNFVPSTGIINFLQLPKLLFGRIDHNLEENMRVTPFFDPMLGKITTFGSTKKQAIKNMLAALQDFKINGIKTNIDFLQKILKTKEFQTGQIHTQLLNDQIFLKKIFKKNNKQINKEEEIISLIAATLLLEQTKKSKHKTSANHWNEKQWN